LGRVPSGFARRRSGWPSLSLASSLTIWSGSEVPPYLEGSADSIRLFSPRRALAHCRCLGSAATGGLHCLVLWDCDFRRGSDHFGRIPILKTGIEQRALLAMAAGRIVWFRYYQGRSAPEQLQLVRSALSCAALLWTALHQGSTLLSGGSLRVLLHFHRCPATRCRSLYGRLGIYSQCARSPRLPTASRPDAILEVGCPARSSRRSSREAERER